MAAEGVQAVLVHDEEEWDDATARFLAVPRVGELIVWGTAPLKVTAVHWCGDNKYPEKPCVQDDPGAVRRVLRRTQELRAGLRPGAAPALRTPLSPFPRASSRFR
jgi:hypothetical protein